ncbi:MAG TPA: urease accessory protein UreD [Nitrososphaeraceae archaeon]|nr:urease accessory protein UreD [Nitrososphaeraceae archaeon]
MESLAFYIPEDIPPEVLAYDSVLSQLGVGKAGKVGALVLKMEHDPGRQKTVAKEQYSKVPLYTQRVLYLEESLPSMAYMYIMSPSGGILQGDRYRMDITLKNDAFFHLTTQGATRLYRMDKNYATQLVNITVGEGCYFEYIPDQIIPYRNSRFYQNVTLNTHDNSTMVYSEILVPGRVGSGESFEYDICYLKTSAKNQNGDLRFIDIALLEPKKRSIKNFGVLEGFDVVGTVYILTEKKYVRELSDQTNSMIESLPKIYGGATILPNNSGVMVRLLGPFASDIRNVIYEIVRISRRVILNAEFSAIRKG